jgi:hypothetical protein
VSATRVGDLSLHARPGYCLCARPERRQSQGDGHPPRHVRTTTLRLPARPPGSPERSSPRATDGPRATGAAPPSRARSAASSPRSGGSSPRVVQELLDELRGDDERSPRSRGGKSRGAWRRSQGARACRGQSCGWDSAPDAPMDEIKGVEPRRPQLGTPPRRPRSLPWAPPVYREGDGLKAISVSRAGQRWPRARGRRRPRPGRPRDAGRCQVHAARRSMHQQRILPRDPLDTQRTLGQLEGTHLLERPRPRSGVSGGSAVAPLSDNMASIGEDHDSR